MKFWKLKMNAKSYLLTYTKKEHVMDVTLCREQMCEPTHKSSEGYVQGEDIRCRIAEKRQNEEGDSLEAICCLGYWYMKEFEKRSCLLQMEKTAWRMKYFHNLITLEIGEQECRQLPNAFDIPDAMHVHTEEDIRTLVAIYRKEFQRDHLHKIAIGTSNGEKHLLRWGNGCVYLSAPVYIEHKDFAMKQEGIG